MNWTLKNIIKSVCTYGFLIIFGIVMIYPLIWLFMASFKENAEIFKTTSLLPASFDFGAYIEGWKGTGQYSFTVYYINTFKLVIPTVIFTIMSCSIVAYGFSRFKYPGRRLFFALMISTLMLPNAVLIIPRYLLFKNLGWLNTYLPFIAPAIFACYPFFIFMFIQFFRGLPKELEEAASIDGCNSFSTFIRIILPLCKPALISAGIFQFVWTWSDFFNPLIYINSVSKYPLALGLRMAIDVSGAAVNWSQVIAMSVVSILPCIILFFLCQKYFVDGIATTGLKG